MFKFIQIYLNHYKKTDTNFLSFLASNNHFAELYQLLTRKDRDLTFNFFLKKKAELSPQKSNADSHSKKSSLDWESALEKVEPSTIPKSLPTVNTEGIPSFPRALPEITR